MPSQIKYYNLLNLFEIHVTTSSKHKYNLMLFVVNIAQHFPLMHKYSF